jgi:outer membrane protein OmpA-like peptidoglycan-associated protein
MIQVGIKQGSLPIKLLFESQLAEFLNNKELRKQYEIWIRQISHYFSEKSDICVDIIGHSSRYGEDEFNLKLSERRAKKIQSDIARLFPNIKKRSRIVGKGSIETIVGTVPDSVENAIDRRVEFKIIDCSIVR